LFFCAPGPGLQQHVPSFLAIRQDTSQGTFSVYRSGEAIALLTQHAEEGIRPYIHPVMAPDGRGILTEFSPAHHKHQTGIYWGLKQVNGRDYFMNWKEDYWRLQSADVIEEAGSQVKWRTLYHLLDEKGSSILAETQTWSLREREGKYILDLEWKGEAISDVTMGKFYVGGLFVRMPWRKDIGGEVINAEGLRNSQAEGQRSLWTDIGIRVPGREDHAHIAILDHPDNAAFPIPWRVDNELGVGPSRQILGDWTIRKGETEIIRYRLVIYTGKRDESALREEWKRFVCEVDTRK
jgi:hypothetical protein